MKSSDRLHNIEVLRGFAALAVTWFHLTTDYGDDSVRASGAHGWLGVDCFFVISGFVIPYSLHVAGYQTRSFGRFLVRRLIRLEPPYLASIGLLLILRYASASAHGFRGGDPGYSPPQVLSHLLYLVPLTRYHWMSPVYWSLAYEFVFYATAGLFFEALWPRHLMFTAVLTFAIFAIAHALHDTWDPRILLFIFGIAAARYYVGRDKLWQFATCMIAATLVMVATGAPLSALAGIVTALVIVFVRFPAWRPLLALGTISYSLYLIHLPIGGSVVNLGRRRIEGELEELVLSLMALGVSMLFAWGFYRGIEVASTRASKRIALQADSAGRTLQSSAS